jgi:hypothetical protein
MSGRRRARRMARAGAGAGEFGEVLSVVEG